MPAKNLKRIDDEGTLFHIYNKGVGGSVIFKNDDLKVFTHFLAESLTPPRDPNSVKQVFRVRGLPFKGTPHLPRNYYNQVELIAYSLKSDHFHLIIRQATKGSLEKFMRSLCTRYSMYFNKKHGRIGSLFAGPYKSVEIKDRESLLLLTRYLHSEGGHSSYPEYLGKKTNPWVNTVAVLGGLKVNLNYKDFVEKFQYDQEGLKDILLDDTSDLLERREPLRSPRIIPKTPSGLPRFLIVSGSVFILLTSIGVGNIIALSPKSKTPLPSTATLGVREELPLNIASESEQASSEAKLKSNVVKVKVEDKSAYVNIRQNPTTNSQKIGKARDGDIFESIGLESGWYEVKLATTSGFIASEYIVTEQKDIKQ